MTENNSPGEPDGTPEESPDGDDEGTEQRTLAEAPRAPEARVEPPNGPEPAQEVQALSTFSEQEGSFSAKIIPVVQNEGADWRIVVYGEGVQGPLYQATSNITDEAADRLGMSRQLQDRVNEALAYADENLQVPPELGNQKRQKRSLRELEMLMEDGE